MPESPLLSVTDLAVAYGAGRRGTGGRGTDVVHGVGFELARGETLALVGQSGSGKSTIARAVSGLLPPGGRITRGEVVLDGRPVSRLRPREWRPLRGTTLGWIPQDPLSSLDPLQRIGGQLVEAIRVGARGLDRAAVLRRAAELLDRVGIADPGSRLRSFPHELSGGQLQRVLIAMAIAADPRFLIADEPTSALDVTVQKRILDLIDELRRERGLGMLFITHDLALAAERSDHVAVLRDGVLLENRPMRSVIAAPAHEYTVQLFSDVPAAAPHRYAHLRAVDADAAGTIVRVRELGRVFPARGGAAAVTALRDVSLDVLEGSVHALVGESGSGKTTLGRIVAGLGAHDAGAVSVLGRTVPARPESWNRHAAQLQLVYQNPLAAVDPRFSVARIVGEPLLLNTGDGARPGRRERAALVREAVDAVALPESLLGARALELSGGQRQRVALARALVAAPRILVLDEPTSALDVTVQSQIVELLFRLRRERGLTYLFISHDLGLVRQIADHVSVLQRGELVETGAARDVLADPQHPYTRSLLDAVPGRGLERTA